MLGPVKALTSTDCNDVADCPDITICYLNTNAIRILEHANKMRATFVRAPTGSAHELLSIVLNAHALLGSVPCNQSAALSPRCRRHAAQRSIQRIPAVLL